MYVYLLPRVATEAYDRKLRILQNRNRTILIEERSLIMSRAYFKSYITSVVWSETDLLPGEGVLPQHQSLPAFSVLHTPMDEDTTQTNSGASISYQMMRMSKIVLTCTTTSFFPY